LGNDELILVLLTFARTSPTISSRWRRSSSNQSPFTNKQHHRALSWIRFAKPEMPFSIAPIKKQPEWAAFCSRWQARHLG
jgi:hypothetical protein